MQEMATLLLFVFVSIFAVGCCQDYVLVWEDNFDFIDLTKWQYEVTMWGGGNNEFQVYTNDAANTYVQNGHLFIKPTRLMDNINPQTGQPFGEAFLTSGVLDLNAMYGSCTNSDNNGCVRDGSNGILPPVMSGRLRSYQRFSFTYGRVDIRARMPKGDWMWPAIWLLPETNAYGPWPASGEMDMNESRGNRDLKVNGNDIGIQEAASTMHWGPVWDQNRYYLTNQIRLNYSSDYASDFHIYSLDWSTNGIRFILDGTDLLTVPNPPVDQNPSWSGFWDFGSPWSPGTQNPWTNGANPALTPFDAAFHFVLNVAVGGTNGFFPDAAVNQGGAAPKPWSNSGGNFFQDFWNAQSQWYSTWQGDSSAMEIDYIRVYQQA